MSLASLTIPAGMTSSKLSKLKSIKPSSLMTSCLVAKIRATSIPTKLPKPNIRPFFRLLLFLLVNPFSFDTGISFTSSPFSDTRSAGLGEGEGVCRNALPIRCRMDDMTRLRRQKSVAACVSEYLMVFTNPLTRPFLAAPSVPERSYATFKCRSLPGQLSSSCLHPAAT